ncbi:MAG: hypothetical protein AAFY11_01635 [Cyanobacteria bacterium J06641_5]
MNARPVFLLCLSVASLAAIAPLHAQEDAMRSKLQNATFELPNFGQVPLTDGQYRDSERGVTATLGTIATELGDLNGDGANDAAAILTLTPDDGAQPLTYLATLTNAEGTPQPLAAAFLGRDLQVQTVEIASRRVQLELALFGPQDPPCCPSDLISQSFRFNEDRQSLEIDTIADRRENPGRNNKLRIDFNAPSSSSDPTLGDRNFSTGGGIRFPL